jgi:DNA-binding NarL/FixJ family response regulator
VIGFVTTGLLHKQIVAEIGVSEITVKVHRRNAMRKIGARSEVTPDVQDYQGAATSPQLTPDQSGWIFSIAGA